MLCYLCGGGGRLGCLCVYRELLCRVLLVFVIFFRIGVLRVGCFVNLRHIPGIVHSGNGKILVACVKLLQTDI